MYSGIVKGIGPRYCPSIEDKIVRFSDKERHQIFLEPESLELGQTYILLQKRGEMFFIQKTKKK